MHTENHTQVGGGVDPEALDEHVAMHGEMAREEPRPAALPFSEAFGCPPNCAHGMNSFTDRGYDLALARLRRG
jgi:hypothetical protein